MLDNPGMIFVVHLVKSTLDELFTLDVSLMLLTNKVGGITW